MANDAPNVDGVSDCCFTLARLALPGSQGIGALNPQLEYLPLLISGALFAFLLDRMVGGYP